MQTITYFHGLIVRGTRNGIGGAACTRMTEVLNDDGTTAFAKESDAIPIAMAQGDPGIPLADVLGDVNAQALAAIEARDTTIATMTEAATDALAAHNAAVAAITAERDTAQETIAELQAQIAELQAQIAELQAPPVDGVPQEVTMRQAQLALLGAGLLDKVEAAIASIPGDAGRAAQITWGKSADVLRKNPLIAQLQGALGLTDAAIDELFVAASKL